MAFYKHELQLKLSTPLVSGGVYYWTNVWYFEANTPTEFDDGEQHGILAPERMSCSDVSGDWRRLTNLTTGTVVSNGSYSYPYNPHWGPIRGPITHTLLLWLYSGNSIAGFKRIRMPVPPEAHDNGVLTATFIADYETNGVSVNSGSLQRNRNGVLFTSSKLDPYVRGWQLRHGSKRVARRVIH